jgi:N-acetylglutamate synthase-like GNAT family acetyltransferase
MELMVLIRETCDADFATVLDIINAAAQAYRGVIPTDRWHEPYMSAADLHGEIAAAVRFWGAEQDGRLLGVMGIQDKGEVTLVRHAYVMPAVRRLGMGTSLLRHARSLTAKPMLVGTWAAATWAIDFYRKNGFALVSNRCKDGLLHKYWSIPERQVQASVVLADSRWLDARSLAAPHL